MGSSVEEISYLLRFLELIDFIQVNLNVSVMILSYSQAFMYEY